MKIYGFKLSFLISIFLILSIISLDTNYSIVNDGETDDHNISQPTHNPSISTKSLNSEWFNTWSLDQQNCRDYGERVAVDTEENIYVVGKSYNSSLHIWKAFILKFNSQGNQIWSRNWSGEGGAKCLDIVTDSSNNLYVTGELMIGGNYHINTLGFNSIGDLKWNSTWGGQMTSTGYGISLGLDNYIYVTGNNLTSYGNDIVLLKYNRDNGNLEDSRVYKTSGISSLGRDIAIDSLNNIYIIGTNDSQGNFDIILLKYNQTLDLNWTRIWNNPFGGTSEDRGSGIAIDSKNNIYIVGSNGTGSDSDFVVLKYNITGDIQWQKILSYSNWLDGGNDIDIDLQDYIYILGGAQETELVLIKYNSSGEQIWNTTWSYDEDIGRGLVITNSSKIIITGDTDFTGSSMKPDMFIGKYSETSITLFNGGSSDGGGGDKEQAIPGYNLFFVIASLGLALLIIIVKRCKK
jgi:hypothetical protein